jgi:hypothetical protein
MSTLIAIISTLSTVQYSSTRAEQCPSARLSVSLSTIISALDTITSCNSTALRMFERPRPFFGKNPSVGHRRAFRYRAIPCCINSARSQPVVVLGCNAASPAGRGAGGPRRRPLHPVRLPHVLRLRLRRALRDGRARRASARAARVKHTFGAGEPRNRPHLRRDWAHPAHVCAGTALAPAHICAGTGLTRPTSAPGLISPRPHLHRDWTHPQQHLRRDWAHPTHICAGTGLTPSNICAGTWLTPVHICAGTDLSPD